MGFYLAFKEIWRSKGRFLLISLVIALITMLVLFVSALAEGLGNGNREFISKIDADLLIYQENTDLNISASRVPRDKLNDIKRVEGVKEVGPISFSRVSILDDDLDPMGMFGDQLDVSLIKVEPGQPGEPAVLEGSGLRNSRGKEAIIGENVAKRTGLGVGDVFTIKSLQGTKQQFYDLKVVGVTDGQQYGIAPSIIVPFLTGDEIKPKAVVEDEKRSSLDSNIVAIRLENPDDVETMAVQLQDQVGNIEAVDITTAYTSTPGYSAQQGTLNTQRYFALLIGVLVMGGFFQIQTLQKVPQIGVLKAIGASNRVVGSAAMIQIVMVTIMGVAIGGVVTLLLASALPSFIPITFTRDAVITALVSLLVIGPLGGLVSVRYSVRVEPLTALGLSN